MDAELRGPTIETLLAHADWVRALAGRLVADPARADDVAQDAWVAAIESPPRDERNVKGWLASIVRNTARELGRGERRRSVRERAASRPEASVVSTDDLVQRAHLQRAIADHVLALDEPYRTVVLLRWFEGLPPREIAKRLDRPLETVTTQLARAHDKLRVRLDREHGDRSTWCAAFTMLIGRTPPFLPTAMGGGAVFTIGWKLAAAVIILTAGWLAFSFATRERGDFWIQTGRGGAVHLLADGTSHVDTPTDATSSHDRVAVDNHSSSGALPAIQPATGLGSTIVEGRLVDVHGAPVAGVRLTALDPSFTRLESGWLNAEGHGVSIDTTELEQLRSIPEALNEFVAREPDYPALREAILSIDLGGHGESGGDGSFRFDVPGTRSVLEADDQRWTIIGDGFTQEPRRHLFVLAPAVALEGQVIAADGTPIAEAQLQVAASYAPLADFPYVLSGGVAWSSLSTNTDANGRFHFERAPNCASARISVRAEGFDSVEVPIPEHSAHDMRIVLHEQRVEHPRSIRGSVFESDGRVASDAYVRFGPIGAKCDAQGRFEIILRPNESYDDYLALVAMRRGTQADLIENLGRRLREHPQGLDDLILRLGGPAMTLRGRVVDADGAPCFGWRVDLADPVPYDTGTTSVEFATAGWFGENQQPKTSRDGAFVLEGLRDRGYRVRAIDPKTGLVLTSDLVHAGSGIVEIRAPADAIVDRVHGRVLSKRNVPVNGAEVDVLYSLFKTPGTEQFGHGAHARTDRNGRFELRDVPRRGLKLSVSGPHVDIDHFDVENADDIVLHVTILCRLRVECPKDDPVDAFEVLDAHGKLMQAIAHRASSTDSDRHVFRDADGLPLTEVGEEATTLVLFKGREELRRVPIALNPDELNVVRP